MDLHRHQHRRYPPRGRDTHRRRRPRPLLRCQQLRHHHPGDQRGWPHQFGQRADRAEPRCHDALHRDRHRRSSELHEQRHGRGNAGPRRRLTHPQGRPARDGDRHRPVQLPQRQVRPGTRQDRRRARPEHRQRVLHDHRPQRGHRGIRSVPGHRRAPARHVAGRKRVTGPDQQRRGHAGVEPPEPEPRLERVDHLHRARGRLPRPPVPQLRRDQRRQCRPRPDRWRPDPHQRLGLGPRRRHHQRQHR